MITAAVEDTAFGKDITNIIQPLMVVICVGIAFKIILTLYATMNESITIDKAKTKVKTLLKALIIAICLSDISDMIVNDYLLSGVDLNSASGAETIIRKGIILFKDLISAAVKLSVAATVTLFSMKLMELQKAPYEEHAELKKQAVRTIILGALIIACLSVVLMLSRYFGLKL